MGFAYRVDVWYIPDGFLHRLFDNGYTWFGDPASCMCCCPLRQGVYTTSTTLIDSNSKIEDSIHTMTGISMKKEIN